MNRATRMALGALLAWGVHRASCKLRAMPRFHRDDSQGDRVAAETRDYSIDALAELYGDKEQAKIVHWRIGELLRAGFDELHAATIAACDDADWRHAIELVRSGCPHRTAVDIVL